MVVNRKPRITVGKRTRKIFDYIREIRERFKQIQWIEGLEWGGGSFEKNGHLEEYRFLPREWHSG